MQPEYFLTPSLTRFGCWHHHHLALTFCHKNCHKSKSPQILLPQVFVAMIFFFVSACVSLIVHVTSMNIINYQWTVMCRVRTSMKLNHDKLVWINVTERSFNLVLVFYKSESPQVRINMCNPTTPNLNPFHNHDFLTTFPIPFHSQHHSSECDAAFLQLRQLLDASAQVRIADQEAVSGAC